MEGVLFKYFRLDELKCTVLRSTTPFDQWTEEKKEFYLKVKDSIIRHGILNPLLIVGEGIVFGSTRYMIAAELGFHTIPCVVFPLGTPKHTVLSFKMSYADEKDIEGRYEYLVDQYKILHQDKDGYGVGHKRLLENILKILRENEVSTVLDYGCGKGQLVRKLRENGFTCDGYDPAIEEFSSMPSRTYDMVISTDVLEHSTPGLIGGMLYQIRELMGGIGFHIISLRQSVNRLPDGSPCHFLVKPVSWWEGKLGQYFNLIEVKRSGTHMQTLVKR